MQNLSSTKTFAMANLYIIVEKRKRKKKKKKQYTLITNLKQ